MRNRGVAGLLLVALSAPALQGQERDQREHVFLVGDAGNPDPGGEPVLAALRREVERDPAHSVVVFLGDNIYSHGLPASGDPERAEAERRMRAQIDAVRGTGGRLLFVPGNHDWAHRGDKAGDAIRREGRFVEAEGGSETMFLPRDGCPGPSIVDASDTLRLIALDTQWWLQRATVPGCPAGTETAVVAALEAALADAGGRSCVVVAHHPLMSGGGHGGHYSWKEHVFPLRVWKGWLWLPLPGLGSVVPLARKAGVYWQDIPSSGYRHMCAVLEEAIRAHPPLVWAAGHDHGLQVLRRERGPLLLVSGAGIYGHTRTPTRLAGTLFASGEAGFMRLDTGPNTTPRVAVLAVDGRGEVSERFTMGLE